MAQGGQSQSILKLVAISVLMFVFAFVVMPPLYDLFCDITGLNGKMSDKPFEGEVISEMPSDRQIEVKFFVENNSQMPWDFRPEVRSVMVGVGESTQINYLAHNPTNKRMVARAVPSMIPSNVAQYFLKHECFCFNEQPLAAGASAKLGVEFTIDPDLPSNVSSIILSYSLFDITDKATTQKAGVVDNKN